MGIQQTIFMIQGNLDLKGLKCLDRYEVELVDRWMRKGAFKCPVVGDLVFCDYCESFCDDCGCKYIKTCKGYNNGK
jgi:hypothetical protein